MTRRDGRRFAVCEQFTNADGSVAVSYWQGTKYWGEVMFARTWASPEAADNAYFRRFGRRVSAASARGRRFEVVEIDMVNAP